MPTTPDPDVFSDWIIDSVPGAREAVDEWERLRAADVERIREARQNLRRIGAQIVAISTVSGEAPNPGPRVPLPGHTQAELDGLELEKRLALATTAPDAAVTAASRRAIRLIDAQPMEERQVLAARVALEAHETAVAAWSTFQEALELRGKAYGTAAAHGRLELFRDPEPGKRKIDLPSPQSSYVYTRIPEAKVSYTEVLAEFPTRELTMLAEETK
jgi:hypothetical protein